MIIKTRCPECEQWDQFEIDADRYHQFKHGNVHVQTAFPELNATRREQLLTGICGKCWDKMFAEDQP